jgi:hypothetical protein
MYWKLLALAETAARPAPVPRHRGMKTRLSVNLLILA